MASSGGDRRWWSSRRPAGPSVVMAALGCVLVAVSADRSLKSEPAAEVVPISEYLYRAVNFLWQPDESGYQHVWPPMEFGWRIVVGSFVGFLGAAFGSVGGVGGGGIYVPMLTLIIGFDPKSSTAISKCKDQQSLPYPRFSIITKQRLVFRTVSACSHHRVLDSEELSSCSETKTDPTCSLSYIRIILGMIMGAAGSTVYYNLKLRHPTLDLPIIDYDLALLVQPMLMLGISIGVAFNVIFADWMVTVLLIILFLGTSTKAFLRGIDTWKKETLAKREKAIRAELNGAGSEVEYKPLPSGPEDGNKKVARSGDEAEVPILENVCWKELGLLVFVWVAFLFLQIAKNDTENCTLWYWVLNLLQVPVAVGVSLFEAVSLYKGRRVISSKGGATDWKVHQLLLYLSCGVIAGIVGGLLGLGGGFILGPMFLELGIPPQVSSATATFAMTFSSSMSVVEYYLLKRFPMPYAIYFVVVATIAAWVGQHVVRRLIIILGRASLIIFILAGTIFISAISLGGVGISNMVHKIENHEYMGFENLCKYKA